MYRERMLRRSLFSVAMILVPVFFVACGEGTDHDGWMGTVDTLSAGTIVVANPPTGAWPEGERWEVEEALRIGELEGTGAEVFGTIRAIEADGENNIMVFDHSANELRVFSPTGNHLWTRGRRGSGPEEFLGVVGMTLDPDERLWLVDAENGRYTRIGPDGEIESFRRPTPLYRFPWLGGVDADGGFYDLATQEVNGALAEVIIQVQEDGDPVQTLVLPQVELPIPRVGTIELPLPFAPQVLWAWDPHRAVWQAVSSDYELTRIELTGDTSLVVRRAHTPTPLSSVQRDSVETYVRNVESQFSVTIQREHRPEGVSPLRWFVVDDERHLWVCATGLEPCGELEVFDPAGRYLGVVDLPVPIQDVPLPRIRDGHFYAAVIGQFGEPQVFVGRIRR